MSVSKITVRVVNNGSVSQLGRTLNSLTAQTQKGFCTRILSLKDFWSAEQRSVAGDDEYVLYLYSGSELIPTAVETLSQAIGLRTPGWLYFDEWISGSDPDSSETALWEFPAFDPIGFASRVDAGEGVVFSRTVLEGMRLHYQGKNVAVALKEMCIAAAAQGPGYHLSDPLMRHFRREEPTEAEYLLLEKAMETYLNSREENLFGVFSRKTVGALLFPPEVKQPVSFVVISEKGVEDYRFSHLDTEHEVVRQTDGGSWLENCLAGVKKARYPLVCFLDEKCEIPSVSQFRRLQAFAELPAAGLVSPCLYKEDRIFYTGAYQRAGIPFEIDRKDPRWDTVWQDIYMVRRTALPAWQCWMCRRDLAVEVLTAAACGNAAGPISRENLMHLCAFEARKRGKSSLYVGDVLLPCDNDCRGAVTKGFFRLLFQLREQYFLDPYAPSSLKQQMRKNAAKDLAAYFPPDLPGLDERKKRIFVLTHELSLTGAPIVLTHAVRMMKEFGYEVILASPADGGLGNAFLKEGVPVLILGDMDNGKWLDLAADADLIWINTVVPFRQIQQLRDFPKPVIWWLHDARSGYEDYLRYVLPETLGENIHVYSVSQYADNAVREFRPKYSTNLLLYGLKDEGEKMQALPVRIPGDKKIFVSVGTVIRRKGQDILADAVRLLPEEIRSQCLFLFIGRCIDQDIFRQVKALEADFPENVQQIDAVAHEEIFRIYKQASAVICSSRDDPLPTFMAETMMVSGVCICSANTGTAQEITHGKNGFVYQNDDPRELAECIRYVAEANNLDILRKESRRLFEEVFSMEIFRENLYKCITQYIAREKDEIV